MLNTSPPAPVDPLDRGELGRDRCCIGDVNSPIVVGAPLGLNVGESADIVEDPPRDMEDTIFAMDGEE